MKSNIVVVLGKPTAHKLERDALITFGRALAKRDKTLVTTRSTGAPELVAQGYQQEGGEPIYITPANPIPDDADEIVLFTDTPYQKKLDARKPDWRDQNWLVFHNRKAINDAAAMAVQILEELGSPLDSGS